MDDFFEHIHDYLDATLSPSERERFERELAGNDRLRAETELQRELRDTIAKQLDAADGLPALRHVLERVGGQHFNGQAPSRRKGLIYWLIPVAAAACLLVVFNPFGWWAADFEALPRMASQVSRGDSTDVSAERAAELFNAGTYRGSAELLEMLVEIDTTVARHRYFLGLSYLGQGEYADAFQKLRPVADGPSVFAGDACYFTAVALWRMGDHVRAAQYAKKVPQGNAFHEKARKLIKWLAP